MKWLWLIAVGVMGTWGCFPVSNVCGQTLQPIPSADGGAFRCTDAVDCPRGAEVYVCVTTGLPDNECVSCDGTQCTLHVPQTCQ